MEQEDKRIIDLDDDEIEDLNDAIKDEGIEVEFGVERDDPQIAFYRHDQSSFRQRITPETTVSQCWKVARAYANQF